MSLLAKPYQVYAARASLFEVARVFGEGLSGVGDLLLLNEAHLLSSSDGQIGLIKGKPFSIPAHWKDPAGPSHQTYDLVSSLASQTYTLLTAASASSDPKGTASHVYGLAEDAALSATDPALAKSLTTAYTTGSLRYKPDWAAVVSEMLSYVVEDSPSLKNPPALSPPAFSCPPGATLEEFGDTCVCADATTFWNKATNTCDKIPLYQAPQLVPTPSVPACPTGTAPSATDPTLCECIDASSYWDATQGACIAGSPPPLPSPPAPSPPAPPPSSATSLSSAGSYVGWGLAVAATVALGFALASSNKEAATKTSKKPKRTSA